MVFLPMLFSEEVIRWYEINKRDLPWRHTQDPYIIWLSEIILQQTRVEQGLPYFYKITECLPTVETLAGTSEDDLLKLWQGLGYYSRARNMHAAAKNVVEQFSGKFPRTYESLIQLKGIGPYTAAAIASFAYNEPHAVVDGNVFRLLSRFFGIETPINTPRGKKEFELLASELIDRNNPATYNQAIIEFGALQCKPVNPNCSVCPLHTACIAWREKKVDMLPVKLKKSEVKKRYFNYLVIKDKNHLYINKRTGKDIWKHLHDFPLIETQKQVTAVELTASDKWKALFGRKKLHIHSVSEEMVHVLSHRIIYARFWEVEAKGYKLPDDENLLLVNEADIANYAFPRLMHSYFDQTGNKP